MSDLPLLTNKERAFVEHYLACWDASKAARKAGYSERTAGQIGYENLKKPEIQAAIQVRLNELKATADEVLTRLTAIARGSFDDMVVVERVTYRPKITVPDPEDPEKTIYVDGDEQERVDVRIDWEKARDTGTIRVFKKLKWNQWGPEVELHDPMPALTLLGKQHGLFKENDLMKYIDLTKLSDDQVERLANGDDPLAVLLNKPNPTTGSR